MINDIKLNIDEISQLEDSKYYLESLLENYENINFDEIKNFDKKTEIGGSLSDFETYLIIKFTLKFLKEIDELIIDKYYDGNEVKTKIDKQKAFCGATTPYFAPNDGICYNCDKQIYKHISLKKASEELITGCPYCSRSYCD